MSYDPMARIVINGLEFINAARPMRFRMTAPAHATGKLAGTGLVSPSITIGSIRVVSILQFPLFQNRPWHPHSFEATVLDENCTFQGASFARSRDNSIAYRDKPKR